jgi:hypothetical protein
MATRPDEMIKNNEGKTRILVDVAILADSSAQQRKQKRNSSL